MTLSGNVVWKLLLAGVTVCKSQLIGRLSTSQRRGLFVFRRRTCLKFRFGSSSAIAELSLCFSKIVATNSHNCVLQNSFASPRICTPERPRVVLAHTPSPFVCSFLAFIQTGWLIDYTNALLLNTGCTMPAPPPPPLVTWLSDPWLSPAATPVTPGPASIRPCSYPSNGKEI